MRKILFPVIAGLFSIIFIASCESDKPDFSSSDPSLNGWVYKTMAKDYLWDVKDSASYNFSLSAQDFLKDIVGEASREKYSALTDLQTAVSTTTYDVGFDYAINDYTADGKTYYIVYYTTSTFAKNNIRRGDNIYEVNGVEVTKSNYETLLPNAIQEAGKTGKKVSLRYVEMIGSSAPNYPPAIDFPVEIAESKNPVYVTSVSGKTGYIAYNEFSSKYYNQLVDALTELKSKNIETLVIDLRYNPGGNYGPAAVLGSALVNNRVSIIGKPFVKFLRRDQSSEDQVSIRANVKEIDKDAESREIPEMGVRKIYVIIGKYTNGVSNVFINALKAYRSDVTLVGEPQYIKDKAQKIEDNIAFGPYFYPDAVNPEWSLRIPFAYAANADGGKDYEYGFAPDNLVYDVNPTELEDLGELGSVDERIFKAILSGNLKSATWSPVSVDSYRYRVVSSIKPIISTVEVEMD